LFIVWQLVSTLSTGHHQVNYTNNSCIIHLMIYTQGWN